MPSALEEAKKLFDELVKDPSKKLTSGSLASCYAIRMYAGHLKNGGERPRDVYELLIKRFGYSSSDAKIVIADVFLDLGFEF